MRSPLPKKMAEKDLSGQVRPVDTALRQQPHPFFERPRDGDYIAAAGAILLHSRHCYIIPAARKGEHPLERKYQHSP
jgi:hypothetical protein